MNLLININIIKNQESIGVGLNKCQMQFIESIDDLFPFVNKILYCIYI